MNKRSLLFIISLFSVIIARSQTADEILSNFFENTGGLENWRKVNTIKMEGNVNMQGMDLNIKIFGKRPNMTKVVVPFQGSEVIRAYDGINAWMINPLTGSTEPFRLSNEEAKELTNQSFEDEFVDYQKKGHEVTLLGEEAVNGITCFKIQLIRNKNNSKEEVHEIHFFDKKNFVRIMRQGYALTGAARGQEVKTYLSEYTSFNGLMIPAQIEDKVNEQTIRKLTIQKVVINDPIEDSFFSFPKK